VIDKEFFKEAGMVEKRIDNDREKIFTNLSPLFFSFSFFPIYFSTIG
jgi:hypothetical protein